MPVLHGTLAKLSSRPSILSQLGLKKFAIAFNLRVKSLAFNSNMTCYLSRTAMVLLVCLAVIRITIPSQLKAINSTIGQWKPNTMYRRYLQSQQPCGSVILLMVADDFFEGGHFTNRGLLFTTIWWLRVAGTVTGAEWRLFRTRRVASVNRFQLGWVINDFVRYVRLGVIKFVSYPPIETIYVNIRIIVQIMSIRGNFFALIKGGQVQSYSFFGEETIWSDPLHHPSGLHDTESTSPAPTFALSVHFARKGLPARQNRNWICFAPKL